MNQPIDEEMLAEIDFTKAVRGRHHIPADGTVFLPTSIERSVWEYFSEKAERKGIGLPQLLTECAGINRHEVENERVLQERNSGPS